MRYCVDGRLEIDNNAVERTLTRGRSVEQITCSWVSGRGGERAASIYSLGRFGET